MSKWEAFCCIKCGQARVLMNNEMCEYCNRTYTLTCEKCGEKSVLNEKMLCEACHKKGDL